MFEIFKRKESIQKTKHGLAYMNVTDLASYFRVTSHELNNMFKELKWLEKSDKLWLSTDLGKSNGALERYNHLKKQKYIVWNENIKSNFELIKHIKHFKEINKYIRMSDEQKKAKGDLYEEFIFNKYKQMNYIVAPHSRDNGKKDYGIDLIAIKDKEIYFIQCKNWNSKINNKITEAHIKKTRMEVIDFIEANPMFDSDNYKKKTLYITSECILNESAKYYLKKHEDIEHLIIPMSV